MSEENGTLKVLDFPSKSPNQGVYKILKGAKLKFVSYENFVPSTIAYSLILRSRRNEYGKLHFKDNFIKAKSYFKNKKSENILDIIDMETGKDKKLWTGSLIGKDSYIKICKNFVKNPVEDKNLYQVIYVNYPEETKQVIKYFNQKNENATVLEFINSKEYKILQSFAERNVKKCLFDFSCRMLFNVSNKTDIYSYKTNEDNPHLIKLQSKWNLNTFQIHNNELYLFKNCISVKNKGELIKVNKDKIEMPYVDVPIKQRSELKAFQVFESQDNIYFVEKKGGIDVKPKKVFSNSIKDIKILIPQMFIIQ